MYTEERTHAYLVLINIMYANSVYTEEHTHAYLVLINIMFEKGLQIKEANHIVIINNMLVLSRLQIYIN